MTKEILEYKIGQTESVINQAKQNPDKDVYITVLELSVGRLKWLCRQQIDTVPQSSCMENQ